MPILRALRALPAWTRGDRATVCGLVAIAAVLRFVDLPSRGTWDADQGHDMLVLRALVNDGAVPLLGPPTSIGDFHHGAWYYFLLAPAAAVGGAAPEAVVGAIAAAGVAAVAVTWWIARVLGGPVAGVVAGLCMAVSASAIEESTFIWNPNLIALSSSIALAGALRAWTTRRARWWLLAASGVVITMQGHVLGSVLFPPVVALLLLDARRRQPGAERMSVVRAGIGGLGILAVGYLPLAVHEVTSSFAETLAALDYLRDGGDPVALGLPARILFVAIRILAWPLTGLATSALAAAVVASAAVAGILAWRARAADGTERAAVIWAAGTLAWSTVALAIGAGSLATVTPGLPNDHYHAFLDPLVFVTVGLGAAAVWRAGGADASSTAIARGVAISGIGALVLFNAVRWPPPVAPDGGWPAARAAAERIARATGDRPIALLGLPDFKSTDAVGFPLVDRGLAVVPAARSDALVVVCDRLFEQAIGAPCGGPAESSAVGPQDRYARLADRFDLSPRTSVSIYIARRP